MRKNVFGRKLKRDIKERKALFKSLMSSLVLKERIKTTEAKAKAIKGDVDKLITKVKKNEDFARRFLTKSLSPEALEKLISRVVPRFKERAGGYTRIIRLGKRASDHAPMVVMEWVEEIQNSEIRVQNSEKKKTRSEKTSKNLASKKTTLKSKKAASVKVSNKGKSKPKAKRAAKARK